MIREIIRVHQHSSEIILVKCSSSQRTHFEKSSYSEKGISEIKNECTGYQWYFERALSNYSISLNCDIEGYCNIRIPRFDASPCDGVPNISKVFKYAIKAIDCYKNIWGSCNSNALNAVHGDYSLEGNILFNRSDVYVIDWEHFHAEIAPIGFDILYMIFELIKMECKNSRPLEGQLSLSKKLINYAKSIHIISNFYQKNYFELFLIQQEKIKFIWKDQYHKLPTSQFTSLQIQVISDYFNQEKYNA